ncbi:hypothetical protein KI387_016139, partial [Taxus chinensis]
GRFDVAADSRKVAEGDKRGGRAAGRPQGSGVGAQEGRAGLHRQEGGIAGGDGSGQSAGVVAVGAATTVGFCGGG